MPLLFSAVRSVHCFEIKKQYYFVFIKKQPSFVSRVLPACKMVVRILSLPPSWRIDRHIVNKHGGREGLYGKSLLKSYKTKKERQAHGSTSGLKKKIMVLLIKPELHVSVACVPVERY